MPDGYVCVPCDREFGTREERQEHVFTTHIFTDNEGQKQP